MAACSPAADGGAGTTTSAVVTTLEPTATSLQTTTTAPAQFPVTVRDDNGEVTIEERPESIVSLSAVATEMLFAIGAGDQVIAVDDQSNYPAEAPMTDLSGFTPNVEAILAHEPDLVFITFDPGDLVASLQAAEVPVLTYTATFTMEDVYRQIESIGAATGNAEGAVVVNETISNELSKIVADAPAVAEGTSYYHEIDNTLYTVTSSTFFGQIYSMFGLTNIADEADPDGSGYPQLSSEYVVASDPDLVFLADTLYGETAETVAARPGWGDLSAVANGDVYEHDSDVASRWGPRVVDFARSIAAALESHEGSG
jgi:iron complex transport system substrate-binding protein